MASTSPRFRIEPLCMALSVEAFDAWFDGAQPGEGIVYAIGTALDQRHPVAARTRALIARGMLRTFLDRRGDGRFDYCAERLARRARDAAPAGAEAPEAVPSTPAGDAGRVLALLAAHAEAGAPCPTNGSIARALDLKDSEAARYLVAQLASAGHIRIENRGPRVTRVLTIAATGARTSAARVPVGKGFGRGEFGAGNFGRGLGETEA